jgi:hypothetical protein
MYFYRSACIAAVLWATFVLIAAPVLVQPDWTIWTPIAAAGAVGIWGLVVPPTICYLVVDFVPRTHSAEFESGTKLTCRDGLLLLVLEAKRTLI